MRNLLVLALCFGIAGSMAGTANAEVVASGALFDIVFTDAVEVPGTTTDLVSFNVHVVNTTGDPAFNPVGFAGSINGQLHQDQPFFGNLPTPLNSAIPAGGDGAVDTHFMNPGWDRVEVQAPNEDSNASPSGEASRMGATNFGATSFGTYLRGAWSFSTMDPLPTVWDLAQIVVPNNSTVDFLGDIAGGGQGDIGLEALGILISAGDPGDNLAPIANANGPYEMISLSNWPVPGDGLVTFDAAGTNDPDGTVESYLWEMAEQGAGNWQPLPVDADTPNPTLNQLDFANMWGGSIDTGAVFDIRLTVTDNGIPVLSGDDTTTLTYVPEPSTWVLLLLGASGLMFWRRR